MSTLNVDMIREIQNDHPGIPEPFLNENKLLAVEEDCRKAFLSSRIGKLGFFGKAFHGFVEAPAGDLVSAYILTIDSEDERKADVLLRFYAVPEDSGWLSPEIEINSLDKIPLGEYLQAGISKMKSTDWA